MTKRKKVAAVMAVLTGALICAVVFEWYMQGYGWQSLAAAIAFYGAFGFGFWFMIDESIREKNKRLKAK